MNREKGSGIRVLVDEQLRIRKLNKADISGYEWEESNHLGVATQVANGKADVGVGSEKFSQIVNVDFIPIMKEQYDLVILKNKENEELIEVVKDILQSEEFHNELNAIGGYDITKTGQIVYEIVKANNQCGGSSSPLIISLHNRTLWAARPPPNFFAFAEF